jgi:hypothetical protein
MTSAGSARAAPSSSQRVAHAAGQQGGPTSGTQEAQRSPSRAAAVVFTALVLATFAGLLLAQRIKHTPTSVQGFRLSPSSFAPELASLPAGARGAAGTRVAATVQLSFRTAKADQLTVAIVSSSGETVATLVRELPWPRYLRLCLTWNGRLGVGRLPAGRRAVRAGSGICPAEPVITLPAGRLAPAGDYRVRVSLRRQHHSVLSPASFALVRGTASGS